MAGTVIADRLEAASTSQLVIENGVALTPPTIADVNGVQIGTFCRAWVNFNGTGTVAIRASFNVSSITDNGVGDYTLNFTNAMPDTNYAITGSSREVNAVTAGIFGLENSGIQTTTAIQVASFDGGFVLRDSAQINAAIFR
jgi:hypothetical protein